MSYVELATAGQRAFAATGAQELGLVVPWTPMWTTRDVLSHLVDNAERAISGVTGPPSADEANEAVEALQDASVAQLVQRWRDVTHAVPSAPAGPSPEWDLAVHLADVFEVWGRPALGAALWAPTLISALTFLERAGRLQCTVVGESGSFGDGAELAAVSDYELFRALFGRRHDVIDSVVARGDPAVLRSLAFFG